jgi:hypothetical protein
MTRTLLILLAAAVVMPTVSMSSAQGAERGILSISREVEAGYYRKHSRKIHKHYRKCRRHHRH